MLRYSLVVKVTFHDNLSIINGITHASLMEESANVIFNQNT